MKFRCTNYPYLDLFINFDVCRLLMSMIYTDVGGKVIKTDIPWLSTCTRDNPLTKAPGLSPCIGRQPMAWLLHNIHVKAHSFIIIAWFYWSNLFFVSFVGRRSLDILVLRIFTTHTTLWRRATWKELREKSISRMWSFRWMPSCGVRSTVDIILPRRWCIIVILHAQSRGVTLKNHKNIGCLSNTGLDPLKNQASIQCFAGWPMMAYI